MEGGKNKTLSMMKEPFTYRRWIITGRKMGFFGEKKKEKILKLT